MPIYEYRCEACGHEHEAMQKMSDAPLTDCPACSSAALIKMVSADGFRLKGGSKKNVQDSGAKDSGGGHACGSGGCGACS